LTEGSIPVRSMPLRGAGVAGESARARAPADVTSSRTSVQSGMRWRCIVSFRLNVGNVASRGARFMRRPIASSSQIPTADTRQVACRPRQPGPPARRRDPGYRLAPDFGTAESFPVAPEVHAAVQRRRVGVARADVADYARRDSNPQPTVPKTVALSS